VILLQHVLKFCFRSTKSNVQYYHFIPVISITTFFRTTTTMPASKKDLKKQQQKKNMAAGIGDDKGRLPSQVKAETVMATCTVCKQQIRMIKKNEQAKVHVESKHPKNTFAECFPGFTCG